MWPPVSCKIHLDEEKIFLSYLVDIYSITNLQCVGEYILNPAVQEALFAGSSTGAGTLGPPKCARGLQFKSLMFTGKIPGQCAATGAWIGAISQEVSRGHLSSSVLATPPSLTRHAIYPGKSWLEDTVDMVPIQAEDIHIL